MLAAITAGGPPVTVTMASGQNARVTFAGNAGQRVSLQLSGVTIGASACCSAQVSILNPDGTVLIPAMQFGTSGAFVDTRTLGGAGTYTILMTPAAGNSGSVTLQLFDVPADVSGSAAIGGAPVTVAVSVPGQNGRVTFNGTAGQHATLQMSMVTIATSVVTMLNPDGSTLGTATIGTAGGSIADRSLPATGTYTIVVDPSQASTGSMTLVLYDANDVLASTMNAGQNARITFSGQAGRSVSLQLSGVTITGSSCCAARVSMIKPDGTALVAPTYFGTSGAFVDTRTLGVSGLYTILIDPDSTNAGSVTLQLYDVPADAVFPITPGGPAVTVSTTTAGQAARATFSAVAGQRVALQISNVAFGPSTCCTVQVSILKPDGTLLVSPGFVGTSGGFIDTQTLSVTGTYTIVVDPAGANTGSAVLQLYDVSTDPVYGITAGGNAVTVSVGSVGQAARVTFSGVAGQRVSLQLSAVTIAGSSCCSARISMLNPDGTVFLPATYFGTSGGFIDTRTLGQSGTYTIVIDPEVTNTGSVTLRLYDVPPDPVYAITPGGDLVAVAIGTPGQNASATFSGVAGRRVSLQLTAVTIAGSTCCSARVSILNPDGTVLVSSTYFGTSGGFVDTRTLGQSGTYTIVIDPDAANVGGVTLSLFDVPADPVVPIGVGGPAGTLTLGTPGQNGSLTFSGTSGQQATVHVTGNTAGTITVRLLRPDGTTITTSLSSATGFNLTTQTLPVSGTYTITVDPGGPNTGIVNVNVTSP